MKLQKNNIRKIDMSQINETENIRKQYDDIEQLAKSIESDGQLQPIGVTEQEDGTYNILYGFRRYHAFKLLIQEGKPYNQIEAKITTGDPAIIQLIENIHRKDLKPEEFENALQALIDSGMSQKEISERLNIRLTRISDALAARKIRLGLEKKGVDTSYVSTSALSQIRNLPEEKKIEVVEKAKKKGGTVKEVKKAVKEAKQEIETKKLVEKEQVPTDKTEQQEETKEELAACVILTITEFFDLPEIKEGNTKLPKQHIQNKKSSKKTIM